MGEAQAFVKRPQYGIAGVDHIGNNFGLVVVVSRKAACPPEGSADRLVAAAAAAGAAAVGAYFVAER